MKSVLDKKVQLIMHRIIRYIRFRHTFVWLEIWNMSKFVKLEYFSMKDTLNYPCYGITEHYRFECVKYHMRILVCLQFTNYGPVFIWHVLTANKFGKGALMKIKGLFGKKKRIFSVSGSLYRFQIAEGWNTVSKNVL